MTGMRQFAGAGKPRHAHAAPSTIPIRIGKSDNYDDLTAIVVDDVRILLAYRANCSLVHLNGLLGATRQRRAGIAGPTI